jgi:hypothetical protein
MEMTQMRMQVINMINQLLEKLFGILPGWFALLIVVGLSILGLIIAAGLAFFLVRKIIHIQWKTLTVWHHIRIANLGNVRSVFHLRALSAEKNVKFQFYYLDQPLPVVNIPVPAVQEPAAVVREQPARSNAFAEGNQPEPEKASSAAAPAIPPSLPDASAAKKAAAKTAGDAKKKAEKGLGSMKLFGTLLGTLGSLLPGSVGASIKEQSASVQSQAQSMGATLEIPEEKLKTVQTMQGQAKNLASGQQGSVPPIQKPAVPETAAAKLDSQTGNQPGGYATTVSVVPADQPQTAQAKKESFEIYAQSPEVPPNGSIELDLRMDPLDRYRSGDFPYWVTVSQWIGSAPEGMNAPEPVRISRIVPIRGLSSIYRVITIALSITAVAVNALWIFFFARWLISFIA